MIPPAPMQSTLPFEKAPCSNPGICFWRSRAPGTSLPSRLIHVFESVNAGRICLYSFPVNFNLEVLVQPDEPHVSVPAKDRHDGQMAALFQAPLEVLVGSRRMRRVRPVAGVAMEMGQELMTELFESDEQVVRRGHVGHHSHAGAPLVGELGALIEDAHAFDLGAG